MYSFIGILLLVLTFNTREVRSAFIRPSGIPVGAFHTCVKGRIAAMCMETIDQAWEEGHFKKITAEHKFYYSERCKITCWSGDRKPVKIENVNQIKSAALQIDKFCSASGIPVVDAPEDVKGSQGAFVGRLSGEYVILQLDGM